jgi:hypothetical protein
VDTVAERGGPLKLAGIRSNLKLAGHFQPLSLLCWPAGHVLSRVRDGCLNLLAGDDLVSLSPSERSRMVNKTETRPENGLEWPPNLRQVDNEESQPTWPAQVRSSATGQQN